MKKLPRTSKPAPMSADAYAGFLKLWLTPSTRAVRPDGDVEAYLRHASGREPLSATARRALGQATHRAA